MILERISAKVTQKLKWIKAKPNKFDPTQVRTTQSSNYSSSDIRASGIKFHLVTNPKNSGNKTLVLLLHGFAGYWRTWEKTLAYLDEHDFYCVTVDLRGYGDSDKPPEGYDALTLAGDIRGLIMSLGYKEAIIITSDNTSIGAFTLAKLHPDFVKKMILVSPHYPIGSYIKILERPWDIYKYRYWLYTNLLSQIPFLSSKIFTYKNASMIYKHYELATGLHFKASPEYKNTINNFRIAFQISQTSKFAMERVRWELRNQFTNRGKHYRKIFSTPSEVKTLIITGKDDVYLPEDLIKKTTKKMSAARFASIHNSGHYPQIEQSDTFNETVLEFIRR